MSTLRAMLSRTSSPVREVSPPPPPFREASSARPAAVPARAAVVDRDLAAARAIVAALDKYHLDPIIGFFVPGLGDVITTIVGAFLVSIAARRGVPPIVIARMLLNLGVDAAVGVVPLVGDLADIGIKANKKNLALLEGRTGPARKSTWRDWAAVVGAGVLVIGAFALAIYGLIRLFGAIL